MTDSPSRTVSAYRHIRSDILAGRLEPDRKLRIQELAGSLGVSPSVVREALSRLSAESLVVAEPQRGFRVAPINAEDVKDLTAVRIDIELKCLRRAMSEGDVSWEAAIVAANHALNRTLYNTDDMSDEWTSAHAKFHYALVAACDSAWLLRIREQLFLQGERYRRINIRMSSDDRDLSGEHTKLAEAVLSRDMELASERMTEHLRLTETLTLQSLQSQESAVA
ncbi:FCD domain-containing protein [Xanthobacter sp. DSM 24535]|uniref:GntR family transcriptional regulator n=1 Tax=Roseixanthobacter psychrophilus TaxID=3119917 RepID=UPI00372948CB